MQTIGLLYAHTTDDVIGYQNRLPWHLPTDLQRFRHHTTGGVLILGRQTWESLPRKPLPNRPHVVLTSRHDIHHPEVLCYTGLPAGLLAHLQQTYPDQPLWCIGGRTVFDAFLPYVNTVIETVIDGFDASTLDPAQCVRYTVPDEVRQRWTPVLTHTWTDTDRMLSEDTIRLTTPYRLTETHYHVDTALQRTDPL